MTQRATRHARPTVRALLESIEPRYLMAAPIDIEGVFNASLDQPRTYVMLQRTPDGDPLSVDLGFGMETFTFEAYYDTGASGSLISKETSDALGVQSYYIGDEQVLFADVGVGGDDPVPFGVSEPLYLSLAPYGVERDLDNIDTYPSVYTQTFGPQRTQLFLTEAESDLEIIDVLGMPTMAGKVIVMDARPLSSDEQLGVMKTYTYNPGTPYNPSEDENDPGIPSTQFHIDLSYGEFGRFTVIDPTGAEGPALRHNPFIGPNPVRKIDPSLPPDNTPGITVSRGSRSTTGSWLFDTGAAASMISRPGAEAVGVRYSTEAGHDFGSDDPKLVDDNGNEIADTFTLQIKGIGGPITAAGFYLDSLVLPTMEDQPIRYLRAPVLVADITVADPDTGEELTLDGVFGNNFLVASMEVNGTELGDVHAGPYDWIVFDEPNGVLGLNLAPAGPPPLPSHAVVGRHVFYNNSAFDGADARATEDDDNAIATNKEALLPGETATFANYTSSAQGINGVIVDITDLPRIFGNVSASSFIIRTGNSGNPNNWTLGPTPSVAIRYGEGFGGSDRITLTWPDGQVRNEWVQVTVRSDLATWLEADDVFYFGNLVGEIGNSATTASVTATDLSATRAAMGRRGGVDVDSALDHRRNGRIDASDLVAVRSNMFQSISLITAPTPASANAARTAVDPASEPAAVTSTRSASPPRRRAWSDEQPDLLGRVA